MEVSVVANNNRTIWESARGLEAGWMRCRGACDVTIKVDDANMRR
jgi:hypothetical protein